MTRPRASGRVLPEGLVRAISVDLRFTEDLVEPGPPADEAPPTESIDIQDTRWVRPGFERYDCSASFVRVAVHGAPAEPPQPGRMTEASVTGMWVQTAAAYPFRTPVLVDWCTSGGYAMRFEGRVVRSTDSGMAIQLETDESTFRFRANFVDMARTVSPAPPSVAVHATAERASAPPPPEGPAPDDLAARWDAALEDPHDDAGHQAFIQACLRAQRLQYALERYRELSNLRPEHERLCARYIEQLGKLIAFTGMVRPERDASRPGFLKIAGGVLIVFTLAIGALLLVRRAAERELIETKAEVRAPATARGTRVILRDGPGGARLQPATDPDRAP